MRRALQAPTSANSGTPPARLVQRQAQVSRMPDLPKEALRRCPACRLLERSDRASIVSIRIHRTWNASNRSNVTTDRGIDLRLVATQQVANAILFGRRVKGLHKGHNPVI